MKRIVKCSVLFGALVLLSLSAIAQSQRKDQRPPMDKEKIALHQWTRVCGALTLDDATQAKFEPVYKKYQAEKMALLPDAPAVKPKAEEQPMQMTDADADQIIKQRLDRASKLADINKKYYTEFRKILSPKQILKVFDTEKQLFKHPHQKMNGRHAKSTPEGKRGR